ncbi:low molecular weight protein-tyrosine-phosphatase [Haliea sp. E1-2-M8]|uniref:low molecular weight protein-tyrosine-phosphatase n=1 Tax=Haliea sp. E1-2-M8 TaxID=3064706 RepID=UPI0027162D4D|nr:low molecular weight protein-tyrosine-phosphatase [Haliea sp. E1-2-M8]MDO8862387.1 low molecular weight protein-tyrosine-phosphatase [Haliea sp. E1-2-M8]
MNDGLTRVLFVCLGNICRSPTADAVFRQRVQERGLAARIRVDSCGTAEWHVGKPPDPRSVAAARERGYDLSPLRARQLCWEDYFEFDYLLAMDASNLDVLRREAPLDYAGHIGLLLDFAPEAPEREVPDPYYGDGGGFVRVLELVEAASEGLLAEIAHRDRS